MRRLSGINFINGLGVVIAVYLIVVLAQTVHHNYQLNQQIAALNTQLTNLNTQNQQLNYDIQYYGTDSFKQREARAKLGLELPGESVLVLPSPKATPAPVANTASTSQKSHSNFRQWFDFLTGNG